MAWLKNGRLEDKGLSKRSPRAELSHATHGYFGPAAPSGQISAGYGRPARPFYILQELASKTPHKTAGKKSQNTLYSHLASFLKLPNASRDDLAKSLQKAEKVAK
jgi:hypothetical protein